MATHSHKSFICLVTETATQAKKDEIESLYINSLTNCVINEESRQLTDDGINCYYEFSFTCDEEDLSTVSWQ